ncbi:MAG: hypothetical protein RSE32_13730 [Comamonas sp.]|uniref:hypothetical protein n=1 Tax=Comamonas sp. TaxID=34028 RepID=UPI002FC85F80
MTSTTDMPTPREIIIETMAMEVEAAHEKHVVAYSINRVKTYGWKLPAGSTGQESEPESMAACIQASDAFDELLRKQLQDAFEYGQAAGQTSAAQCLHQIQEPPTKTEALAHYSQQATLAMSEADGQDALPLAAYQCIEESGAIGFEVIPPCTLPPGEYDLYAKSRNTQAAQQGGDKQ